MVGLSIVLESHHQKTSSVTHTNNNCNNISFNQKTPQVINKTNMIINKTSSFSSSTTNPFLLSSSSSSSSYTPNLHSNSSFLPFLEHCFLCGHKLLAGKDIYMYKGDRGFCSVECRCRQIFMDEEDSLRKENCSFANSNSHHQRKSTRNRAGGFVAY